MHVQCRHVHVHVHGSFFTALGVLCCFALFVCLTLLASFFLPSHLSFKNMYIQGAWFGVGLYLASFPGRFVGGGKTA